MRVRRPAELLELPKLPVDDFPAEPFAKADAASRSLEKAKELPAWIEGKLTGGDAIQVELDLVTRGGARVHATTEGQAPAIAISKASRSSSGELGQSLHWSLRSDD